MCTQRLNGKSNQSFMATGLVFSIFLGICLLCGACSKMGSVEGVVKDCLTGQPLSGVKVTIGGTNLFRESDDKGKYRIKGVIPGNQGLEAEKEGYIQVDSTEVVIGARARTPARDIRMLKIPPADGLFMLDTVKNSYLPLSQVGETSSTMGGNTLIEDKHRTKNIVLGQKLPLVARWPQNTTEVIVQKLEFFPEDTTQIFFSRIKNPDRWVSRDGVAVKAERVDDTIWLIDLAGLTEGDYLLNPKGAPGVYDFKFVSKATFAEVARYLIESIGQTFALRKIAFAMAKAGKIEEALELAKSIKDPNRQDFALSDITVAMAKAGKIEEALELAKSIKDANGQGYALCYITAKAGKIEEALKLAKSIKGAYEQADALRDVAVAMVTAGKTEQALDVAKSIKNANYQDCALSGIAEALAKADKTEQALKLAKSIKGAYEQADALRDVAVAMVTAGKTEQALDVAKSIKGASWQGKVLRGIAVAMAKAGNTKKAIELAKSINDKEQRIQALVDISIALLSTPMDKSQEEELARRIMTAALVN